MNEEKPFTLSVIDCQSLNDITDQVEKFDMVDSLYKPLKVTIKLKDRTLFLGLPRVLPPRKAKYRVKIIDSKGYEWGKILEEV